MRIGGVEGDYTRQSLGRKRADLETAPRSEWALAAGGLVLLAALLYGDHVLRGGFAWDDWENAGTTRFPPDHGFLGPFDLRQAAYRPLLALLIPLPHLLFGTHPAPQLAFGLACAVAAAGAFFALLRAAGATRAFALAAAALALVFPWSASTRLWATATLDMVAPALAFAAGAIGLRALAAGAPSRRVALSGRSVRPRSSPTRRPPASCSRCRCSTGCASRGRSRGGAGA